MLRIATVRHIAPFAPAAVAALLFAAPHRRCGAQNLCSSAARILKVMA